MRNPKVQIVLIFLTLITFLANPHAFSQDKDTLRNNSLVHNAWALQFQIGSNFTLWSFQGAVVSVKRQLNACEALRLGVSGSFNFGDNTGMSAATQADTAWGGYSSSRNSSQHGIALNMQYLVYPNPEAEINLFFGVGPVFQYSYNLDESEDLSISPNLGRRQTSSIKRNSWGVGLSGLTGVEWFATRALSLHAEYGVTLIRVWSSAAEERAFFEPTVPIVRNKNETKQKAWQFNANSVKFGLSVYF